MYATNRNDCVQYIADLLQIKIDREILPNGWYHQKNCMIENIIKMFEKQEKIRISKLIFNPTLLRTGDIVIMRLRGKYAHHIARHVGNNHVEHNLPNRGICLDLLVNRFFIFGVRLWVL